MSRGIWNERYFKKYTPYWRWVLSCSRRHYRVISGNLIFE
jgi:hypothetical protein